MRILREPITIGEVFALAVGRFGDLVKAVVDVERRIMAVDAELHADEESFLLDDGSRQSALWGINLYPADRGRPDWIEFDSMINVRPSIGNVTRSVEDPAIRSQIIEIVDQLVMD